MTVSDGAIELYYTNYLFGFLASVLVYSLLHLIWPAQHLDAFVRDSPSAESLQQTYREQWECVATAQMTNGLENAPESTHSTDKGAKSNAAAV